MNIIIFGGVLYGKEAQSVYKAAAHRPPYQEPRDGISQEIQGDKATL
jgi:hypothetical protein